MPSQVFNRHYWSARELVVLGVFSAAAKLSTLLVALVHDAPDFLVSLF